MNKVIKQEVIALRREIHQHPELSGMEHGTAARIVKFLNKYSPDKIYEKIGGDGLLVEYNVPVSVFTKKNLSFYSSIVAQSIPMLENDRDMKAPYRILFRCELDALPITEESKVPYKSQVEGVAHLCGHDGHAALMCAFAAELWSLKEESSSVNNQIVSISLLFQPAEETGEGAARVAAQFNEMGLKFDFSYAFHNRPGINIGDIIITEGPYAYASTGVEISLHGQTSHASEPHLAISPTNAIAEIIIYSQDTNRAFPDERLCTIVYIDVGEKAYGTTPGSGTTGMTIRAKDDINLSKFKTETELFISRLSAKYGLKAEITYHDYFPATVNNTISNEIVRKAANDKGLKIIEEDKAQLASDDFAHLTTNTKASFIDIGSGYNQPALHEPDFDFPDEIIELLF